MQYLIKIAITALIVVAISEVAKRNQSAGAVLASLPVTSILAITWYYCETNDLKQTSALTISTFYMVIPSLSFFIVLPLLLKQELNFWISMLISSGVTFGVYFLFFKLLTKYKLI